MLPSSLAIALVLFGQVASAQSDSVPLYDDMGNHHREITSRVPAAQAYFDQGLRLYYAFNHAEAIRAFREAQRRDSTCAICFWGEALAWGPNINAPMDSAGGVAAHAAVQRALALRTHASEPERARSPAWSAWWPRTRRIREPVTSTSTRWRPPIPSAR